MRVKSWEECAGFVSPHNLRAEMVDGTFIMLFIIRPFGETSLGTDGTVLTAAQPPEEITCQPGKFECPAFLFQHGRPTYFYGVGDLNIHGDKTPEVYVLRIDD